MVQVRSTEDHKLLPGVEAGDVGEKLGYATMDNGYLSFDKVRIPRTNLLSRFVDIDK
jgi:acyl-CoA oxidase